jgi:hypothetical protein
MPSKGLQYQSPILLGYYKRKTRAWLFAACHNYIQ